MESSPRFFLQWLRYSLLLVGNIVAARLSRGLYWGNWWSERKIGHRLRLHAAQERSETEKAHAALKARLLRMEEMLKRHAEQAEIYEAARDEILARAEQAECSSLETKRALTALHANFDALQAAREKEVLLTQQVSHEQQRKEAQISQIAAELAGRVQTALTEADQGISAAIAVFYQIAQEAREAASPCMMNCVVTSLRCSLQCRKMPIRRRSPPY